jgi:hypothetical protein
MGNITGTFCIILAPLCGIALLVADITWIRYIIAHLDTVSCFFAVRSAAFAGYTA